jgi:peroxiredoxin
MQSLVRIVLAAVFGFAGALKLLSLREFRETLSSFRVPLLFVPSTAIAIPLLELVITAGLLWPATAWRTSIAASVLLLLFTLVLVINLIRGRRPKCRCFGKLQSSPIDWTSVGINCIWLALSAELVLAGPQRASQGLSATRELREGMAFGFVLLAALAGGVAFAIWLCLQVLRQNGRVLSRLEALEREMATIKSFMGNIVSRAGLPIGSRAPSFQLSTVSGETVTLEDLLASERSSLLVFVDPDCSPCQSLMADFERWEHELGEKLTLALVSRGKAAENRRKFGFDHRRVLLQTKSEVAELYQCSGTPAAVLISPAGYVQSDLGIGTEGIKKLVNLAVANALTPTTDSDRVRGRIVSEHARAGLGRDVPAFSLADLEGNVMTDADLDGSPTLLVFWNPNCTYCVTMLEDLHRLEARRDDSKYRLVFISTGTSDANRSMNLHSRILMDSEFSLGRALGVAGTPSAALVDSNRRIASTVAVGASAVLELAHQSPKTSPVPVVRDITRKDNWEAVV